MPSENKTPNYRLNQWQENEFVKRQDFVEDNLVIDKELKNIEMKVDEKIVVTSDPPAIEDRKTGSFYFILTESSPVEPNSSIKVSPTMGIKIKYGGNRNG